MKNVLNPDTASWLELLGAAVVGMLYNSWRQVGVMALLHDAGAASVVRFVKGIEATGSEWRGPGNLEVRQFCKRGRKRCSYETVG